MGSGLEIVNISDVGRKRPHNEDSTASDTNNGVFVLADGMGGYKAGEVASAIAVMTILDDIGQGLKNCPRNADDGNGTAISYYSDLLKQAIHHANSNIYELAQNESDCEGMGTTVVTGLVYGNQISIGNVGDSRLYRLRNKQFEQITKDHSLIQELIDRGFYTKEEAESKTPRNLVTRALGLDAAVEVDIIEDQVLPGDIYLLCSDGLNDMVNDEEIHLTLSKYSANLVQAANNLVSMANNQGGKDNISIVIARVNEINAVPAEGGQLQKFFNRFFDARG